MAHVFLDPSTIKKTCLSLVPFSMYAPTCPKPSLGNGVPITAGGRGSSQWPSFGATAVGRAHPNAIPWLKWLLHEGNLQGPPAYTPPEIKGALARLGGNAESCPELIDCVARLFVAAKRVEKEAWASQQW